MMKKKHFFYFALLALTVSCGTKKSVEPKSGQPSIHSTEKETVLNKKEKESVKKSVPEYKGAQWVENISRKYIPTKGLANRHLALWASHGRYFNNSKEQWQWQRPILYCTTEDLFTQTIVVPYLMPMLENAGATVFSPRERDWQPNEIIVDNDNRKDGSYTETEIQSHWTDGGAVGFGGDPAQRIYGGSNPFTWGTTRKAKASREAQCMISYQPDIPQDGQYAVYVSYPNGKKNVSDAEYTVVHKGVETKFLVNQKMGSGTWVYLGTFSFEKGNSSRNRVVLTNASKEKGFVVADAVRFGGGMGNISRQGQTSGLPRCLEGARYYAQWAGAPDSVYNTYNGTDDYKDDINARSRMANWLAGGSCFAPDAEGKDVPIELSLAVHSDAGYASDFKSIYGSLSICTTNTNGGVLGDGTSRQASRQFADMLLEGMGNDLKALYGKWNVREVYDRNYSETRQPLVPSAIIETLSHQSFPDMRMAQDPNVKFSIARSIYKTVLKFLSKRHDKSYMVQPLPPVDLRVDFVGEGLVELSWESQRDPAEPSAMPQKYIVYTSPGSQDFDNGEDVKGNKIRIKLSPDVVYSFKVTAVNDGGESFPSEAIAAVYHAGAEKTVLVVNGFHRLSSPSVRDDEYSLGFDMDEDFGIDRGLNVGWSGKQTVFDKTLHEREGAGGLGYGSEELVGKFIMGNNFCYPAEHAQAIAAMKEYNVVSCSSKAIEKDFVDMGKFAIVDLILGLERNGKESIVPYKTFPKTLQGKLSDYLDKGGKLLVSGAYIASDMTTEAEKAFLSNILHVNGNGATTTETLSGMGTSFDLFTSPNEQHYASPKVDILQPTGAAFSTLLYSNGTSAAVAYSGSRSRTVALGFPFECITSASKRKAIMKGFIRFLDKK